MMWDEKSCVFQVKMGQSFVIFCEFLGDLGGVPGVKKCVLPLKSGQSLSVLDDFWDGFG